MLKQGYIKHTVNKNSFSEQCYYVFGDMIAFVSDVGRLRLDDDHGSERDTLLGALPQGSGSPWHDRLAHQIPAYTGTYVSPAAQYSQQLPWGNETVNYGVFGAGPMASARGSNSIISGGSGNDHLIESHSASPSSDTDQVSQRSGPIAISSFKNYQQQLPQVLSTFGQVPFAPRMLDTGANNGLSADIRNGRNSDGSVRSSGSSANSQNAKQRPVEVTNGANGILDPLDAVPSDLTGSRQSFTMAMGNPCDFVKSVDVM